MAGATALLSAAVLATVSALPAASPAGADTVPFAYTCSSPTLPSTAFPATTLGTIPQGMAAGTHFTISNLKYEVTIPASVTTSINAAFGPGAHISSSISTTIDAVGATPANNSVTATFPSTLVPASGPFSYTGTGPSPTFTATGGSVSLSAGTSSSAYSIVINGFTEPDAACSTPSPPPVIAYSEQNAGHNAYIANGTGNSVSVIDTSTDHVVGSPIGVGSSPDYVAITPDGTKAFVTNNGGGLGANSVSEINTATGNVLKTITVNSPRGIAISPNGATAWVVDQTDDTLVPISVATGVAGTGVPDGGSGGGATVAISPDGTTGYVVDQFAGSVTVIDLVTSTISATIPTGLSFPGEVELSPDGTEGYVDGSVGTQYELQPFSTATDTLGSPIDVCSGVDRFAVSADGTTAWAGCSGLGEAQEVDLSTSTVAATIPLGLGSSDNVGGVSLSPDGTTAYAVDTTADKVVPIDTSTATTSTPIAVGSGPDGIAIMPDQGPTAAVTSNYPGTGLTVPFSASSSVPGTTPTTSYSWNFGDGHTQVTTVPTVSHTYAAYSSYTVTVTETDAAGTSTTQVFDGQTAMRNGGPQAAASTSVVLKTTPCVGTSCTATVAAPASPTAPAQTVVVRATATATGGSLSVSASPALLTCTTHGFQNVTTVDAYSPVGFTASGDVHVIDVLKGVKSAVGVKVCFKSHGATVAHYLAKCTVSAAPCISLVQVVATGVRVQLTVPPGDPKWRVQTGAALYESPTSIAASVAIGSRVTITGTGLLGANGATRPKIGFTSVNKSIIFATIDSAKATAIVVTVPKGAATGPVVMVWPTKTDVTVTPVAVT